MITKIWQPQFKDFITQNFIQSTGKHEFLLASITENILRIFDSETMNLKQEIILDSEKILDFCSQFNVKNIVIIEPLQIDRQIILDALKNFDGSINLLQANRSN